VSSNVRVVPASRRRSSLGAACNSPASAIVWQPWRRHAPHHSRREVGAHTPSRSINCGPNLASTLLSNAITATHWPSVGFSNTTRLRVAAQFLLRCISRCRQICFFERKAGCPVLQRGRTGCIWSENASTTSNWLFAAAIAIWPEVKSSIRQLETDATRKTQPHRESSPRGPSRQQPSLRGYAKPETTAFHSPTM